MNRLIGAIFVSVILCSGVFAVSTRDTNLDVVAPGKALYGKTANGVDVRIVEVDSNGAIEFDNGTVGASFAGALTVDGATTMSGDPTISSSTSAKPVVSVTNTNADGAGVFIKGKKLSASPADNDDLMKIQGVGYDSEAPTTENETVYAQILIESDDVTEASKDGSVVVSTMQGGTLTDILTLDTDLTSTGKQAIFTSSISARPIISVINTNEDTAPPAIYVTKDSASPVDNDRLGYLYFLGDDSGGTQSNFVSFVAQSKDVTDTTEDGVLNISTLAAGASTTTLRLESGQVAIATSNMSGALHVDGSATITATVDSLKVLTEKVVLDTVQTFTDSDATPDVGDYSYFNTNTSAVTITDFDGANIEAGQLLYVVSKGAITYDVTSSGIKGGTTDIVTAAGDLTAFLYDGTDWYVTSRIDASDDLN